MTRDIVREFFETNAQKFDVYIEQYTDAHQMYPYFCGECLVMQWKPSWGKLLDVFSGWHVKGEYLRLIYENKTIALRADSDGGYRVYDIVDGWLAE